MIVGVVPACGSSRRMGRPKLALPIRGVPLIARVVEALRAGGLDRVLVVAPPSKIEGAEAVAAAATGSGAIVLVLSDQPPDMRASVEYGLDFLSLSIPPTAVAITPGDVPGIDPEVVSRLLDEHRAEPDRIILPVHGDRGGHPVLLPWVQAETIRSLPPGVGLNTLLKLEEGRVLRLPFDSPAILADVDTPEDYERYRG